jgi:hypothetical protein
MSETKYLDIEPDMRTKEQWRECAEDNLAYIAKQTEFWKGREDGLRDILGRCADLLDSTSIYSAADDLAKLLDDKLGDKAKMKMQLKTLEAENAALKTVLKTANFL